jgi:hypothetical protein
MTKELDYLVTEIVQKTTVPELNQVISALKFQLEQKRKEEIQTAKQAFIKAYKEFRRLDPWEECWVGFGDEDGEYWEERDLFSMMDEEFLRGE